MSLADFFQNILHFKNNNGTRQNTAQLAVSKPVSNTEQEGAENHPFFQQLLHIATGLAQGRDFDESLALGAMSGQNYLEEQRRKQALRGSLLANGYKAQDIQGLLENKQGLQNAMGLIAQKPLLQKQQQAQQAQRNLTLQFLITHGKTPQEAQQILSNNELLRGALGQIFTTSKVQALPAPKLAADYQAVIDPQTGQMKAIPIEGSAAWQRQQQTKKAEDAANHDFYSTANTSLDAIGKILNYVDNGGSTGFLGKIYSHVPGSEPYGINNYIEQLKSINSLEKLQELRKNSPTGAALGRTTQNEFNQLANAVAAIDLSNPKEQIRDQLLHAFRFYNDKLPPELQRALPSVGQKADAEIKATNLATALAPTDTTIPPRSGGGAQHAFSRQQAAKTPKDISPTEALLLGAGDGLSFGFDKNLIPALQGSVDWLKGKASWHDAYAKEQADFLRQKERAKKQHDKSFSFGQVGGAVLPLLVAPEISLPGLSARAGISGLKGALARAAKSATTAGAYSGLDAIGHNNSDPLLQAVKGVAFGAVAQPAVEGVAKILKLPWAEQLLSPAQAKLRSILEERAPNKDVAQALAQAQKDNVTPYRMVDALRDLGSSVLRKAGQKSPSLYEKIEAVLNSRSLNQSTRLSGYIHDAFGTKGQGAQSLQKMLEEQRAQEAALNYARAHSGAHAVPTEAVLQKINETLQPFYQMGRQASASFTPPIYQALLHTKKMLMPQNGAKTLPFSYALDAKKALDDMLLKNAGTDIAARLRPIRNMLDEQLEKVSPAYHQARNQYRYASEQIDAISKGAEAVRAKNAQDSGAIFAKLKPHEQQPFLTGFADKLAQKVEASPWESNRAKSLLNTDLQQKIFGVLGKDKGEKLLRQIELENVMHKTAKTARGTPMGEQQKLPLGALTALLSHKLGLSSLLHLAQHYLPATGQHKTTSDLVKMLLQSADGSAQNILNQLFHKKTTLPMGAPMLRALLNSLAIQNSKPSEELQIYGGRQ